MPGEQPGPGPDVAAPSTGPEPAEATPNELDRITKLEEALANLHKKVTNQARTITKLRKQVEG